MMTAGGATCTMIVGKNDQFEARSTGSSITTALEGTMGCGGSDTVTGHILVGNDYVQVFSQSIECGSCE
jgi:hypothetical protein